MTTDSYEFLKADRAAAVRRAQDLLARNVLVLDTETTGLGSRAEVCQIAVVRADGVIVVDEIVKPGVSIEPGAAAIHGITNEMVEGRGALKDTLKSLGLLTLLTAAESPIGIYNAAFDLRVLDVSLKTGWECRNRPDAWCIMGIYAEFVGSWHYGFESYTSQSLSKAAYQCGLRFEGRAHSALADARMALAVLKVMAECSD